MANKDLTIIGGHQRYEILRKTEEMADVYFPERPLTKEEVEELAIRLNRNSGEWDFDILANHFEVDELIGWGFDLEEFHLGDDSPAEEAPKPVKMTITFSSDQEAYKAEKDIAPIIANYEGASYKVTLPKRRS